MSKIYVGSVCICTEFIQPAILLVSCRQTSIDNKKTEKTLPHSVRVGDGCSNPLNAFPKFFHIDRHSEICTGLRIGTSRTNIKQKDRKDMVQ
jgi:hypothetical protein